MASIGILAVREVFISSRSSTVRCTMFTCRVTSLITCIQFRLFIKEYLTTNTNFALIGRRWSLLSILVTTAWLYCKRLQNDWTLNFRPLCIQQAVDIVIHVVWNISHKAWQNWSSDQQSCCRMQEFGGLCYSASRAVMQLDAGSMKPITRRLSPGSRHVSVVAWRTP